MLDTDDELKIDVKVDDEVATGSYSNYSNLSYSPEEFVLDFLYIQPTPPPGFGKLTSRIILSPGHAKRLLDTLAENIDEFEERFGAIGGNEKQDNNFGMIQ